MIRVLAATIGSWAAGELLAAGIARAIPLAPRAEAAGVGLLTSPLLVTGLALATVAARSRRRAVGILGGVSAGGALLALLA